MLFSRGSGQRPYEKSSAAFECTEQCVCLVCVAPCSFLFMRLVFSGQDHRAAHWCSSRSGLTTSLCDCITSSIAVYYHMNRAGFPSLYNFLQLHRFYYPIVGILCDLILQSLFKVFVCMGTHHRHWFSRAYKAYTMMSLIIVSCDEQCQ